MDTADGRTYSIEKADPSQLVQIRRSPYIDRALDNAALADYMSCHRKFFYGMVLNRRRTGPPRPAITFGATLHTGLETWYKTGDAVAAYRAMILGWQQHDQPDDHRTIERAVAVLEQYIDHYGTPEIEARGWGKTVGYPSNPLVEIPVEIGWPGGLHPYTGRIDRVVEWQGLYYVEDHKSTSALGATYFRQFDPDNQMMGYATLAELVTGLPIAGVRINAIGVLKTQTKFAREVIAYPPERLAEWRANYNQWVRAVERSYFIWQQQMDEGVALTEDEALLAAWPHNFKACSGKYGMCQYTSVCTVNARLRPQILEADYGLEPWDPMRAFEASETEGV